MAKLNCGGSKMIKQSSTKITVCFILLLSVFISGCGQVEKQKNEEGSKQVKDPKPADVRDYNDIVKAGVITEKDDWIYYMDYKYSGAGKLYKVKPTGEESQMVHFERYSYWDMKMINDWIYYLSDFENGNKIYKVKLDGSDKALLVDTDFKKDQDGSITLDSNVASFDVVGDTVYYSFISNKPDKFSKVELYSIKTDGTNKTKIGDGALNVYVKDGWIYYKSQEESGIYKIKLNGSEKTKVTNGWPNNFIIVGEWIYYAGDGITKVKIDGTNKAKIYDSRAELVVNADDEWIYFSNGNGDGIYKIKNTVNPEGTMPMFVKPF